MWATLFTIIILGACLCFSDVLYRFNYGYFLFVFYSTSLFYEVNNILIDNYNLNIILLLV